MTDEYEAEFNPFKIPDTPMICGEWYAWWRKAEPIFREWQRKAENWDKIQIKQPSEAILAFKKLEDIKSLIRENKVDHTIEPIIDEFGDGIQYIIKKLEKILGDFHNSKFKGKAIKESDEVLDEFISRTNHPITGWDYDHTKVLTQILKNQIIIMENRVPYIASEK